MIIKVYLKVLNCRMEVWSFIKMNTPIVMQDDLLLGVCDW